MVAEAQVQFICSDNLNAPILPNSWNALINVLDAALVNGLNLPAINSAVVDGSTIVLTFSSNHNVKLFQVVALVDFTPFELNTKWRVIGVPNALQIVIDRHESIQGVATLGSARLPPLGYEKPFSATGKGVYRNANQEAEHRPFLRVDCTQPSNWGAAYAKVARVGLMTECTSIDDVTSGLSLPSNTTQNWESTGTGNSATTFYAKWIYSGDKLTGSNYTGAPNGNKKWTIVGDEEAFYLIVSDSNSEFSKQVYGFGIYETLKPVPYPYFLGSYAVQETVATTTPPHILDSSLPWRGYMASADTTYGYASNYFGAKQSKVLIMSNAGGTTNTDTYFGKHAANAASDSFIPQFVMLNMQGKFKHIMHALWVPNTNTHFKTQAFDGDMFLIEPALYKSDSSASTSTYTMPFYLGSL